MQGILKNLSNAEEPMKNEGLVKRKNKYLICRFKAQ